MGRKVPTVAAPDSITHNLQVKRIKGEDVALIRQTREYELITPLFGGGTETQKADPVSVIRVPSIRGQLRFWWRAIRGGQFSSIAEMKKIEDLIWGSTETPSAVIIELKTVEEAKSTNEKHKIPFTVEKYQNRRGEDKYTVRNSPKIAPYATFPLLPDKNQRKQAGWTSAPVRIGLKFKIEIRHPETVPVKNGKEIDLNDEVSATLWAWETFGGIGARTRRGFGAIRLCSVDGKENTLLSFDALKQDVEKKFNKHFANERSFVGVPQLSRESLPKVFDLTEQVNKEIKERVRQAQGEGHQLQPIKADYIEESWKYLIKRLSEFRQQRNPGTQRNRPGRSKWPEPERIRELTGQRYNQPPNHHQPIEPKLEEFPRAAFGLPIVFQFQQASGRNPNDGNSDPRKTILQPTDHERLSSPLILRPLACADDKAIGLALILESSKKLDDLGVTLTTQEGQQQGWSATTELDDDKAKRIVKHDGSELLNGEKDVLKAFLKFLDK